MGNLRQKYTDEEWDEIQNRIEEKDKSDRKKGLVDKTSTIKEKEAAYRAAYGSKDPDDLEAFKKRSKEYLSRGIGAAKEAKKAIDSYERQEIINPYVDLASKGNIKVGDLVNYVAEEAQKKLDVNHLEEAGQYPKVTPDSLRHYLEKGIMPEGLKPAPIQLDVDPLNDSKSFVERLAPLVETFNIEQLKKQQEMNEALKQDSLNNNTKGGALRFNKGKTRFELVSSIGLKELARVYTLGAHKYTKYQHKNGGPVIMGMDIPFENVGDYIVVESADNNWRKGQDWLGAMASIKRHIAAWYDGEDIDPELGTYHLANAAWGLFTLLDFYKSFPEGDNRQHSYLVNKKIGLDIDEVLADWVGGWCKLHNIKERPKNWAFFPGIFEEFEKMRQEGTLDDFYLNLDPLVSPDDIPFEPHCYITSRPVSSEVSAKWLHKNGFPVRPVYTVDKTNTKTDYAQKEGLDLFVDDGFSNFRAMNAAGICTYLMDAPHNQRYDVGHKRLKSLKDLK